MSQTIKLKELLLDCQPHSTIEIMEKVYGGSHLGLARVGARIFDLRKIYTIEGWKDEKNPAVYWYQMKAAETHEFKLPEPQSDIAKKFREEYEQRMAKKEPVTQGLF